MPSQQQTLACIILAIIMFSIIKSKIKKDSAYYPQKNNNNENEQVVTLARFFTVLKFYLYALNTLQDGQCFQNWHTTA